MINGILNIYKEKGYTSHDVVARLRGIVKQKKIGHTGTLDPDAEGVLLVCLGKATKLCGLLTDQNKVYETVLLLGKTTDTQDITGRILEERETDMLKEDGVRDCIEGYIGEYEQLPPMYSALKVNGKKLYELAREGKEVERKRRKVRIRDIQITEICLPRIRMTVQCSKGTYIRTLCHDIGQSLGCGGCMEFLRRTQVGCFGLEGSRRLDQVERIVSDGNLQEILLPVDMVFKNLQEFCVSKKYQELAYNGNRFPAQDREDDGEKVHFEHGERVRIYDRKGQFIGIFQYDAEENTFYVEKMFLDGVPDREAVD